MAKLTVQKRKALPKSKFAEPKERKYPIQDKAHAVNAKARASQMEKKGKLSEADEKKINMNANKVLGRRTLGGVRK